LAKLILHFLDWIVVTCLVPLFLIGTERPVFRVYLAVVFALAMLSAIGLIHGGNFILLSSVWRLFGRSSTRSYSNFESGGSSHTSFSGYGSCGGKYTGPPEGDDPWASSDDYYNSFGARYVVNKKTKVVFDVNDPAAKRISYRHRRYMDDLPYDFEDKGYRIKRDS
jgi:hypothetical protein